MTLLTSVVGFVFCGEPDVMSFLIHLLVASMIELVSVKSSSTERLIRTIIIPF